MLIETLTVAAGRLTFTPGQELDLPEKEAKELIAAGAARAVVIEKEKPKGKKASGEAEE